MLLAWHRSTGRRTVTLDIAIVLILVGVVFVAFIRERLPPDLVALLAFSALLATGVLGADEALAVFSNSGPITVGAMFVLSAALERTGMIDLAGRAAARAAGRSPMRALVVLAAGTMAVSAFMNNTPVVVVLTPVAIMLARSFKIAPTRFLIPLSFASIFGGTTTLIGTSTNLLVNGVIVGYGQPALGMFEITAPGLLLGLVGIAYMAVFGRWLLPDRQPPGDVMGDRPRRAFLAELLIPEDSPLVGKTLPGARLVASKGVGVLDVIRRDRSLHDQLDRLRLEGGDRVVVHSSVASVVGLRDAGQILFGTNEGVQAIGGQPAMIMEGIVGPQSRLVGFRMSDLNFRRLYGVYILAVHRQGTDLRTDFGGIRLRAGDTLILEGPPEGLRRLFDRRVLVNLTEPTEQPFRRDKAPIAIGAVAAVMVLAALGVLPIAALALIAATAVVALGCLSPDEAYGAVEWRILFLIFGTLGLGMAMETTGAAALIATQLAAVVREWGPVAVLALIYLLTSALTEIISNNAAAILVTPIAVGLAQQVGVDPRPFAMAVLFAASASFATPIGYQANTFVYSAGGYRFMDFVRIGLPLNLLMWGAAVLVIPAFWPLTAGE